MNDRETLKQRWICRQVRVSVSGRVPSGTTEVILFCIFYTLASIFRSCECKSDEKKDRSVSAPLRTRFPPPVSIRSCFCVELNILCFFFYRRV